MDNLLKEKEYHRLRGNSQVQILTVDQNLKDEKITSNSTTDNG
jgi:hypothetical protein